MFTRDEFRIIQQLRCFLNQKNLHYQHLFIPEREELTLETLCLAVRDDFDEFDGYTEELVNGGMRDFLSTDQLEDIVDNLQLQSPTYADSDLLSAINFYIEHDAFIDLENPL